MIKPKHIRIISKALELQGLKIQNDVICRVIMTGKIVDKKQDDFSLKDVTDIDQTLALKPAQKKKPEFKQISAGDMTINDLVNTNKMPSALFTWVSSIMKKYSAIDNATIAEVEAALIGAPKRFEGPVSLERDLNDLIESAKAKP